ncbi:hypothetical protein M885DRAFT_499169 [Pelagophyceae sp. CCMP2097]|nr:hypothetical protein M885DRAFT_499169 [Pelagophyceae sp. CCMP2097]
MALYRRRRAGVAKVAADEQRAFWEAKATLIIEDAQRQTDAFLFQRAADARAAAAAAARFDAEEQGYVSQNGVARLALHRLPFHEARARADRMEDGEDGQRADSAAKAAKLAERLRHANAASDQARLISELTTSLDAHARAAFSGSKMRSADLKAAEEANKVDDTKGMRSADLKSAEETQMRSADVAAEEANKVDDTKEMRSADLRAAEECNKLADNNVGGWGRGALVKALVMPPTCLMPHASDMPHAIQL